MLTVTFQHLRGVGHRKEQALWRGGVASWEDLESRWGTQISPFNGDGNGFTSVLDSSRCALNEGRVEFFADRLARQEHYRIALSFPRETLFLDIETTGLSKYYDEITLVGWSNGWDYHAHIAGDDPDRLFEALAGAKVVVTFNGTLFDLPFLRNRFQDLPVPPVHVDLRFLARRVGLSGGQKAIERELKIKRFRTVEALSGETAPILWHRYRRGDLDALRLLLAYNYADVQGMKRIFDEVVSRLLRRQKAPICSRELHRFASTAKRDSMSADSFGLTTSGISLVPYRGRTGPAITFEGLRAPADPQLRIVGIDPTGSPLRPSGWCLLEGNRATTKRLGSDEELIGATMASRPHLVSIDSPLSLPTGRTSGFDDDPGRARFGITRYCERVLKKRGVSVYPCLIKSMQGLTQRGMRLADTLRKRGVPVIESYPGAAQDILGIPRKRAGIEFLKTGLIEFGLSGEFQDTTVSHDELDAITSALVGVLFWSGCFEALGNDDEGYLIIPDIKVDGARWRERRVIGLSGQIGSGKTLAGRYLEALGFHYGRFSLVLAELLKQRGVQPSRATLQQIGEEVHRDPGQRWLGTRLIRMLPSLGDLVIDGLRHPEDHSLLVEAFGPAFRHIHIGCPKEIRRQRYVSAGGNEREFDAASSHPVEANISQLSSLAHVVVSNVDDTESLLHEFKGVLREI